MNRPEEPAGSAPDGDGSIHVLGTAHVSEQSAERVRETVEAEDPDIVAVELDKARYQQLQGETPDDLEAKDLLGGGTVFQFLAYWMLSYVQQRMGDRFDVEPGADMQAAVDVAESDGRGLALVDREIQTTIQRFWARLTLGEKAKLLGGVGFGIADPVTVGLTVGGGVGLGLGLIVGMAILPAFGVMIASGVGGGLLTGVLGGAVVGAIAGALITGTLVPTLSIPGIGPVGTIERGVLGLGAGGVAGIWLAISGTAVPVIGTPGFESIGDTLIRAVVSGSAGLMVGGLVGMGIGMVLVRGMPEPEVTEEFDPESLTDGDVVTAMMEEFRRFSPGGAEALIDERDAYIAHKLHAIRNAGYDAVAVVGAGHKAGIEEYLENPASLPDMESITGVESGSRFSLFNIFGYLVLIGFLSFFGLLAMAGARNTFLLQLFVAWFLFNGVFAFAAARLAGARLQSASVGGLVAWMTSINPMLAPGWFAGYVELRYRPVNVTDIKTLNELLDEPAKPLGDIIQEMLEVPLFKLIAVVAMTNIGSLVATVLFPFVVLPFFFDGISGVSEIGQLMLEGASNSAQLIRDILR